MQERKIQFIFWNSSNLIEVKRISVKVEHFESCMIVKESPTGDQSDMQSDYDEEETIEPTAVVDDGAKKPPERITLSALGALGNAMVEKLDKKVSEIRKESARGKKLDPERTLFAVLYTDTEHVHPFKILRFVHIDDPIKPGQFTWELEQESVYDTDDKGRIYSRQSTVNR